MSEEAPTTQVSPPPPHDAEAPAEKPPPPPHRRIHESTWKDVLKVWGPVALLGLLAFFIAWSFVEPAPPSKVRISTGSPGGAYERIAQRYAVVFGDNGVQLESVPSVGSTQNVERLLAGEVDAALVQAGTVSDEAQNALQAVVAVTYEPLLVFVRADAVDGESTQPRTLTDSLTALAGKRVAVGVEGSGTRTLVEALLDESGLRVGAEAAGTQLLEQGGQDAADALRNGQIDAACFVMSPEAPMIRALLEAPGVALLDLRRAAAWSHRLPYLASVTLDEGVFDPARNLPPADVHTVAPVAYLAVRTDTHRAVVQLLVEAAQEDALPPGLIEDAGEFPSLLRMDLPVADEARFFFERGPNFLHRVFPFWLASLIDRLIILTVPLLVVLIPLLKAAPPAFRWNVRRRIYRWYRQLRIIDEELSHGDVPPARLEADLDQLRELDTEVAETDVPLSYMEEFYNLRLHIAYMLKRVEDRLEVTQGS